MNCQCTVVYKPHNNNIFQMWLDYYEMTSKTPKRESGGETSR